MLHRRSFLSRIALLFAACVPGVRAEGYPARPIRMVVPFAPGSATDSMARVLAQELTQRLGQNVIVDNRAGAFGQIAAQQVARSTPDGYTLILTTNTTHSANPHLYRALPYDPVRDFEPIARLATLPFMLVAAPSFPARTLRELLDYVRARPGQVTYASASSTALVAARTFETLGHLSMIGVNYKASPQAVLDVAAGQVQVMMADFVTAMPHVTAGRLRVYGVTTTSRSALLPDTPPIAETLSGFDVGSWNGLFAPAGTPKDIVARLAREAEQILARPEIRTRLAGIGFEVAPLGSDALGRYVREQLLHWGRLVREAGIQPE